MIIMDSYERNTRLRASSSIFLVLLVTILLSSCAELGSQTTTDRSGSSSSSRTPGIQLSFVEGVPPDRFYVEEGTNENVNFEAAIEIRNTGEFPQDDGGNLNGRLHLTGFDRSIIRNRRWEGGNTFDRINGVSSAMPEGGIEQKIFRADDIYFPSNSREYPVTLMLNACYYYETDATATVCVDPDPRSRSGNQACNLGEVSLNSQQAPLQVTEIVQTGTSSELIFSIQIENRGNGKVLRETGTSGVVSEDRCMNPDFDETDRLTVDARVTGLSSGRCSPEGSASEPLRMYDGRGEIVCRFPLDNSIDSAYTTEMQIDLGYGYQVTERKDITLVNTERN